MLAGGHALRRCQLDHLLGGEAVRAHDRFGTALLRAGRQPFERAAAVGLGGRGADGNPGRARKR